jgi:hypothetical protein
LPHQRAAAASRVGQGQLIVPRTARPREPCAALRIARRHGGSGPRPAVPATTRGCADITVTAWSGRNAWGQHATGPTRLRGRRDPDMDAGASRICEEGTAVTSIRQEQERPRHAGGRLGAFRHPGALRAPRLSRARRAAGRGAGSWSPKRQRSWGSSWCRSGGPARVPSTEMAPWDSKIALNAVVGLVTVLPEYGLQMGVGQPATP